MESADNVLRLLDPRRHMGAYLEQGLRYDGRSLSEARKVHVDEARSSDYSGNCIGAATVHIQSTSGKGGTSCMCHITLQVGKPSLNSPGEGDVIFDVSLGFDHEQQQQQLHKRPDDAVDIETLLYNIFVPGAGVDPLVPLQQLCLVPGQSAYRLCVSLVFLSQDGNLQDCAIYAVWHALKRARLPRPSTASPDLSAGSSSVPVLVRSDAGLKLTEELVCSTFAIWQAASAESVLFLSDPTRREESLGDGTVTVVRSQPYGGAAGGNCMRGLFFNAVGNGGALRGRTDGPVGLAAQDLQRLLNGGTAAMQLD